MARVTLKTLREEYPRIIFADDGYCYTATAPDGHTLDGDLHEYVANYKPRAYGPTYRAAALSDLKDRLAHADLPVCFGACDWCDRDE